MFTYNLKSFFYQLHLSNSKTGLLNSAQTFQVGGWWSWEGLDLLHLGSCRIKPKTWDAVQKLNIELNNCVEDYDLRGFKPATPVAGPATLRY